VHRLGILLLLATGAFAQGVGVVRGSVVDARGGEALSSVDVGGSYRTVTGAAGRFLIGDVSAGEYMLNASTIVYRFLKNLRLPRVSFFKTRRAGTRAECRFSWNAAAPTG
jgi:hypothetical protein